MNTGGLPGSIFFWWAFFALGVLTLGAGIWGQILRRIRRRRLRADLSNWPEQAGVSERADFLLSLVRQHALDAPHAWREAAVRLRDNEAPHANPTQQASELNTLRDQVLDMPWLH